MAIFHFAVKYVSGKYLVPDKCERWLEAEHGEVLLGLRKGMFCL